MDVCSEFLLFKFVVLCFALGNRSKMKTQNFWDLCGGQQKFQLNAVVVI